MNTSDDTITYKYSNVPTKEEFDERFNSLISEDYSTITIEETINKIKNKLGPLPKIYRGTTSEMKFIRARKEKSIGENEDICTINPFTYPKNQSSKNLRANIKDKPVFYCSLSSVHTILKEIKSEINDIVYLSVWKKPKGITIKKTLFLPTSLPSDNIYQPWIEEWVSEFKKGVIEGDAESLLYAVEKINELFLHDNYELTSKIAHSSIYDYADLTDCIVYPSVAHNYKDLNIAIHPDYVDENLILTNLLKVRVTNVEKPNMQILKCGEYDLKTKVITWSTPRSKEELNNFLNDIDIGMNIL